MKIEQYIVTTPHMWCSCYCFRRKLFNAIVAIYLQKRRLPKTNKSMHCMHIYTNNTSNSERTIENCMSTQWYMELDWRSTEIYLIWTKQCIFFSLLSNNFMCVGFCWWLLCTYRKLVVARQQSMVRRMMVYHWLWWPVYSDRRFEFQWFDYLLPTPSNVRVEYPNQCLAEYSNVDASWWLSYCCWSTFDDDASEPDDAGEDDVDCSNGQPFAMIAVAGWWPYLTRLSNDYYCL